MYKKLPLVSVLRPSRGAPKSRMSISSFRVRILISLLIMFLAVPALWPAVGRTEAVLSSGTESNAGGAIDAWLVNRGLIASGLVAEQSSTDAISPPIGTEVNQTRQTENRTGEVLNRVTSWNETAADDTVHFEVTILSADQFEVAFWLFPNHRKGCTLYQWTLYDHGRALQSAFWRNDAAVLRLAGAADLPPDLYPDSVPWVAFLRVLDAPRDGAEGMLHQQITPYSYVGQRVWAKGPEEIRVPRHFLRARRDRTSRRCHGNAELATLRPARHRTRRTQKYALLRGDAALPVAQAGGHHLCRRPRSNDGTDSHLYRWHTTGRGRRSSN